jgi:hypothetical protein
MSAMLESLLNDECRATCCVNDAAMAAGRPILVSQAAIRGVQRTNDLQHREVRAQSDPSNAAPVPKAELQ